MEFNGETIMNLVKKHGEGIMLSVMNLIAEEETKFKLNLAKDFNNLKSLEQCKVFYEVYKQVLFNVIANINDKIVYSLLGALTDFAELENLPPPMESLQQIIHMAEDMTETHLQRIKKRFKECVLRMEKKNKSFSKEASEKTTH